MQGSPPSGNLGVAGPIISWYEKAFRRCIMNDLAHRRRAVSTVLAGIMLLFAFASQAVAAQDVPAEIEFRVHSYYCDTDPGNVSPAAGNIPDACDPLAGVSYTIATTDGTFSTTCVTEASGMCIVMAPNEADVTVTQDAPPPGMAPRENPISTTVVTEFAGVLFINLPTGTDPAPEPAPSLPDTGTGPGTGSGSTLPVTLAAAAALLATAALTTRKRMR